eukprot:CAMPEP_0175081088 /NCGR_PEP_ID=MMETSP0052_2-20121109/25925_1 /TAXON_ID=51329 ORGANISM="Polytomella parva, Strain SAG 63-3" /NCGR_SAMPLE_ID=MMETSP0052_2 /ASSEMBLY_ACC=CAM_ASM_000194 /LENGTH=103 /DNA_ID=CAMNT_0016351973 /DNA_START=417 /DNA_END=728 /DNA_ORIENTATION=+
MSCRGVVCRGLGREDTVAGAAAGEDEEAEDKEAEDKEAEDKEAEEKGKEEESRGRGKGVRKDVVREDGLDDVEDKEGGTLKVAWRKHAPLLNSSLLNARSTSQ